MIARTSVRGSYSRSERLQSLLAYGIGLLVGGCAYAVTLNAIGNLVRVPSLFYAAVAVGGATLTLAWGVAPKRFSSRWKVPQSWNRFGIRAYAALFGISLGLGALTEIGSFSFFAVSYWDLTARSLEDAMWVGGSFGVGRALPILVFWTGRRNVSHTSIVGSLGAKTKLLALIEVALLILTAAVAAGI